MTAPMDIKSRSINPREPRQERSGNRFSMSVTTTKQASADESITQQQTPRRARPLIEPGKFCKQATPVETQKRGSFQIPSRSSQTRP